MFCPSLILQLEDDLGQHRMGDVVAGLGVLNGEILALLDHLRQVFQRHIGAGARIVEAAIGIFLDYDLAVVFGHIILPNTRRPDWYAILPPPETVYAKRRR